MDDLILIKGGTSGSKLKEREVAYHTAEKALYIGAESGNIRLCGADDVSKIDGKLTAEPVEFQASLEADAEIGEVVTAFNNLISALKASGVMNTE